MKPHHETPPNTGNAFPNKHKRTHKHTHTHHWRLNLLEKCC